MDLTLNFCIGIIDIPKYTKAAQNTKCNRDSLTSLKFLISVVHNLKSLATLKILIATIVASSPNSNYKDNN